jgi:hypothetical protein
MCHLSRSRNTTLLCTFLRRMIPLRSWSRYLWEKKVRNQQQKLNNCHIMMATMTTMTMRTTTTATTMRMTMMRTTIARKKTTRITHL